MTKASILLFFSLISATLFAQKVKKYEHSNPYYSIEYPEYWNQRTDEQGKVFFTSQLNAVDDDFAENINIGASPFNSEVSLKELAEQHLEIEEVLKASFINFKVISNQLLTVNGQEFLELVYEGELDIAVGHRLKFTQWFTITNEQLVTVTFTETTKNESQKEEGFRILNSLKMKK